MKRQTSGCIRQVRREEEAAVGRDRVGVAEQVLEHRRLRARRVDPLRDLRELLRVAEQDDVAGAGPERERVGERDLPGLVDEERVDDARPCPRGRRARRCRRGAARRRRGSRSAAWFAEVVTNGPSYESPFFSPRNSKPVLARRPLDLVDRLWIALWLVRGHADPPAELHQAHDQPRAGVGLPRPGRPLDHEVPAAEPRDELLRRLEVVLRERGRERLADEDRLRRGVARRSPASTERARRRSAACCSRRRVGPAGDQRRRQRHLLERGPAAEPECPRLLVERLDRAGGAAGRRVEDGVSLRRGGAAARGSVNGQTSDSPEPIGRPRGLEPADRVGVALLELLARSARSGRRTPTRPASPRAGGRAGAGPAASAAGRPRRRRGGRRAARRGARRGAPRSRPRSAGGSRGSRSSGGGAGPGRSVQQPVAQPQASRRQSSSL